MRVTLLSLPILASAAVLKRDVGSITTAINYISSNCTKLNNTVSKLKDNDSITGVIILFQSGDLKKSVDNAASVVSASEPLNDDDSGTVATQVLNLEPVIFSLLDNIVAHKPQFQTALLGHDASFLVESNLKSSKKSADSFGAALTPKLSETYQQAAPIVIKQIDDAFDSAIAAFA